MKFIHRDQVDSTSSEAMRLLAQGETPPFMVHADEQSSGRGRRGRKWEAAPGNLYVTFAMDAAKASPADVASWPLRLAALVCEHLSSYKQLRLKWPNDLVFGGLKIGGVLGESMLQGQDLRAVVVGLGLNLQSIPAGDLEAPAATLGGDPATIAALLHTAVRDHWEEFCAHPLADLLAAFGLPHGQVWHEDGKGFVQIDYREDGSLVLRAVDDDETRTLSSATHTMQWANRSDLRGSLLTLDVGNTNARLGVWTGDQVQTYSLSEAPWSELTAGLPVFAVSTHRERCLAAERTLARHGLPLFNLPKCTRRLTVQEYDLTQMGADRLAAMEGYLTTAAPSHAALIVSVGTAVTIDRVVDGEHLGGMILPGFAMALAAMEQMTDALPAVEIPANEFPRIGADTESAMRSGVYASVYGAICVVREEFSEQCKRDVEVILTGGGADKLPFTVDADLIARGIRALAID